MKKSGTIISGILVMVLFISLMTGCKSSKTPDTGLIPVLTGEKWEYVDQTGKILINPQFSFAGGFFEGLALVKNTSEKNPLYGFIDKKGIYVVNPQYVDATSFSEGLACVVPENGAPTFIDKTGHIVFVLKDARRASIPSEGFIVFSQLDKDLNELWGFADCRGVVKVVPQFYSILLFSDGLAAVKNKEDLWGFADKTGHVVINYQFHAVSSFNNGLCIVYDGSKYGFIDNTGKYVINPQFEEASDYSDNLIQIKLTGKCGFVDKTGKIMINPQFDEAFPFKSNLAAVEISSKWGFIGHDGKYVINPQFEAVSNFTENIAFVLSGNKIGFIDKEGKYIANPTFDNISKDLILGESVNKFVETAYSGGQNSSREIEDRMIADSVRYADSIAMVQAEQQRIVDSITAVSDQRVGK